MSETDSMATPQAIEAAFQEALDAHRADDLARAEAGYRRVMQAAPRHPGALHMRALIAMRQARLDEAETWLKMAAESAKAWEIQYDLGYLMELRRRDDEAEAHYRQAIALHPGCAEAHYNLGALYARCGRDSQALEAYRATLDLDPRHAGALNNLGLILRRQGRRREALDCFQAAARLQPYNTEILNNLATLTSEDRQYGAAATYFARLLSIDPHDGHAAGKLAHLARQLCAWDDLRRIDADLEDPDTLASQHPVAPFDVLACALGRPRLRAIARHHAERVCGEALRAPPLAPPGEIRQSTRLRIGYLSGDLQDHPVTHLVLGVLRSHDRHAFDIRVYAHGPGRDATTDRVRGLGLPFEDLHALPDAEIARRIATDRIDILVDLTGHTQYGRPSINALRPAPIIVNWLGFPGSLGHERLADYLLGDATLTPLEHAGDYSETLALLPHCYQPLDPAQEIAAPPRRAEAGLPEAGVVFCCFNQAYKLSPEMLEIWCALLREVPGSVLWLLEPAPEAVRNLRRFCPARGIDATRLVLAPRLPLAMHLARIRLADIALDTYPYGSGATGGNMLLAGVPMVTRLGDTYVGRMGASLMRAAGLPELVAGDAAAYHDIALRLALDADALRATKARLAAGVASRLFDSQAYAGDLERLYRRMWDDHRRGARTAIVLDAEPRPAHPSTLDAEFP